MKARAPREPAAATRPCRLCSQMPPPPHSLHRLLTRLCSQISDPPHSLHRLLLRLCSHRLTSSSHCPGLPPRPRSPLPLLPPSSWPGAARLLLPSPLNSFAALLPPELPDCPDLPLLLSPSLPSRPLLPLPALASPLSACPLEPHSLSACSPPRHPPHLPPRLSDQ